jgi:hypothetical protein
MLLEDARITQEVCFLGFPYGSFYTRGEPINRGFLLALVKRAIGSSMPFNGRDEVMVCYLDGINNPGFSGGSAVWTKPNANDIRRSAVRTRSSTWARPGTTI